MYNMYDRIYTPLMLIKEQKKMGHKIGMVIDLTVTDRYYDKSIFIDYNIKYYKFRILGGRAIPSKKNLDNFCDLVKRNRYNYICVHCTHGYNRTGLFICYYLCKVLNKTVIESLNIFKRARPDVLI